MAEVVSEFRSSRVHELAALIDGCADESLDISAEAGNIISRMRELYFFAPDLAGMVQHLKDVALHNNLLYWAKFGQERGLDELPWGGRVNQAAEQMLTEPPLYQRDWSHGAIQPQYAEAITGWLDLRECARRALQRSARAERIDELELVVGSTTVFKFGASEKFKILQSPAVDLLDKNLRYDIGPARPGLGYVPGCVDLFRCRRSHGSQPTRNRDRGPDQCPGAVRRRRCVRRRSQCSSC